MKLERVKVIGIESINIKDKNTSKTSTIYRYYFITGDADLKGVKTDFAYANKFIDQEYIPVIQVEVDHKRKYKIVEME